jgi:membrane protease YdiL (CAAX protease family)
MADSAEQFTRPRNALVRFAQARPLTLFSLLAYLWSWTLWGSLALLPQGWNSSFDRLLIAVFIVGICGPTVAALVTSWLANRDLRICRVWTGWRSLIAGLAFGLAAFFVTALFAPTAAIAKAPFYALHWSALLHWSTYAINYSTFIGGPVNEEPGWRGFALPRLQERYGPVRATLILAPLWAGWHLPLFWMEGWSSANPPEFLLILVGISFLMTAAANISKFNIVVAVVLHAFFNTSSGLGNTLTSGLPRRAHEMVIYTFAVLICGGVLGLAGILLHGKISTPSNKP